MNRSNVGANVLWSSFGIWSAQAIALVVFMVLARLLDPKDFGVVALGTLYVMFIQLFIDQGFSDALVQKKDAVDLHFQSVFWVSLGTGIVVAFAGIACSGYVADFFGEKELGPVIAWLSLTFVTGGLTTTHASILRKQLMFKELGIRSLIAAAFGGGVAVIMAYLGFGVWSLVAQRIVGGIVTTIVLWKVSDWRPTMRFSFKHVRELMSFGIQIVGTNILAFINTRADRFFVGKMIDATSLGFYTVGNRLVMTGANFLTAGGKQVSFPIFSMNQGNAEHLSSAFLRGTQIAAMIALPVFVGMGLLGHQLVPLLFGPQWVESVVIMQWLCVAGAIHSVIYLNMSLILAIGKASWRMGLAGTNAATNIIALWIAAPYGMTYLAMAYSLRTVILASIPIVLSHRLLGFRYAEYAGMVGKPIVLSGVMGVAVLAYLSLLPAGAGNVLTATSAILIGIGVYGLLARVLMPDAVGWLLNSVRQFFRRSRPDKEGA